MRGNEKQQWLERLASSDHFEVCAALKRLPAADACDEDTIVNIVECCSSSFPAVERCAVSALIALGPRAQSRTKPLLIRLSERLTDAGCTFDCCGFSAFLGPIDLYIEAVCSSAGTHSPAAIHALLAPLNIPGKHKALIVQMVESL